MSKLRIALPLALVAAALAVPAALSGQAADNIKVAGHADIITSTQVAMYVTYTCLPTTGDSSTGSGFMSLQGAPGHGSGAVSFTAICDDTSHSTTVIVTGGPFTPGDDAAFGSVCGSGCGTTGVDAVEVVLR